MTHAEEMVSRARALLNENRVDEALETLAAIAETVTDAAMLSGVAANRSGDLQQAVAHFERASVLAPTLAAAPLNLGLTLRALSRNEEAEAALTKALVLDPNATAAHFALGNLRLSEGAFEQAVPHFSAVVEMEPGHLGALNNLGICRSRLGDLTDAANCFNAIVEAEPGNTSALSNLGAIRAEQGQTDEAIELYRRSLDLDPAQVETLNNLGVALLDKGHAGEAAATLRAVIDTGRAGAQTYDNLGNALLKVGDPDGAAEAFGQSLALEANDGIRVKQALVLPVICASTGEMAAARSAFEDRIDRLISAPPVIGDPFVEVGLPSFNLSYQDANNRPLMEKLANMYTAACPSLGYTAPHCGPNRRSENAGPVRIGFVSRFFQSNSVGRCFHGVLRFSEREDVEVTAFTFTEGDDPLWQSIVADVHDAIVLPAHLPAARVAIAEAALDVLVFTDIGMDPLTYFLAFARLAPLQCALGGHPDAIGIPNIDVYLSCAAQEPSDAEEHYRASLIKLPGAPTYYERPELPNPMKPRSAFSLPEEGAIYFCGQTLIKVHPEMDVLFGAILERDRTGLLVFPEGYTPELATLLRKRFGQTLSPEALGRVHFLPAMSHMDYMNVMALADVSLDTRPFGGGNTSWQAISAGTPMVSWPGNYLRGRYTQALYGLMGIDGATAHSAEEYISLAVRFATDQSYAASFNADVAAASAGIFEDRRHLDALYSFLVERAKAAL